jgi:hypothetical protein
MDLGAHSFSFADKRYILHICRQRFKHLDEAQEKEATVNLIKRYNISAQKIKNWLASSVAVNIDAVGKVPALPPLYSPGPDGKFNSDIARHPDFDINFVVQFFNDHRDVLLLSYETIQDWYGINRSTFGKYVTKSKTVLKSATIANRSSFGKHVTKSKTVSKSATIASRPHGKPSNQLSAKKSGPDNSF